MFFKNQRRNPFSAYRAFMSPYKWTSSVMACQTVVNLASRSNHFKCKQFDSLSFSTPSKFCVILYQWFFRVSITCSCFYRLLVYCVVSIFIWFSWFVFVMKISLSQLGGGGNSEATRGKLFFDYPAHLLPPARLIDTTR